jgi:hypothetical protein
MRNIDDLKDRIAKFNPNHRVTVLGLRNSRLDPLPLCFEPWGDVLHLVPGQRYVLVADLIESETNGIARDLEIDWSDDCTSISSLGSRSELSVYREEGPLLWYEGSWSPTGEAEVEVLRQSRALRRLVENAGTNDAPARDGALVAALGLKSGQLAPAQDPLRLWIEYGLIGSDRAGSVWLTERGYRLLNPS